MKIEASENKMFEKPHIKKGFYTAKLLQIRNKNKESKYGQKLVFLFEIIDSQQLQLAYEAYAFYKKDNTGLYTSALTPNSQLTKTFEALGWKFNKDGVNTDDFLGKLCEVLVDDYVYEFTEDNKTIKKTGSVIRAVNPLNTSQKDLEEEFVDNEDAEGDMSGEFE